MISKFRFALVSLYHYRRSNVATALGVIVATTVFTGAFLVGHSMRASLRYLALDAIGSIDQAVLSSRFMPEVSERTTDTTTEGMIMLEGTLQSDGPQSTDLRRVRSVKIYGVTPSFWNFFKLARSPAAGDASNPSQATGLTASKEASFDIENFSGREVVLNRATADALRVAKGDSIVVRLPRFEAIPAETIFGHTDLGTESLRLKVHRIIPDEGPGRFTLNPSQHSPMLAYIPLETLQKYLDMRGQVNVQLRSGERPPALTLGQLGLHVESDGETTFISTDRMLFLPGSEKYLVQKAFPSSVSGGARPSVKEVKRARPVLTYLANSIRVKGREKSIPYSTVTAYDFEKGAFSTGPLGDDQIVLNAWAAKQLGAKVGETITLRYFRPDSTDSSYAEATYDFRLVAILPMAGVAIDRRWTPSVAGITDELSMADWDPPFPFEPDRIRPEDEAYWKEYKATPKAFVSYKTGKRLWGSRHGDATSIRITPPLEPEQLDRLAGQLDPSRFGLAVQDVRRRALEASVGTTSFAGLFLSLSFFVIGAALILVALMFRLGVDARASSLGLLAAVGFSRRQIARILLGEGLGIAVLGSFVGVLLGVLYAWLMILGLSTWWIGAIGTPFLTLHVTAGSLLLGFFTGTLTSAVVIALSIRRIMRIPPSRLLAGQTERETRFDRLRTQRRVAWAVALNLWVAVGAIFVAYFTIGIDAKYETLTFFGSGFLTLLATLATVRLVLLITAERPMLLPRAGNRLRFAMRSAARHPMRSMAIVGMMAATVFLVVSVGAFRIGPVENDRDINGPTGGFQLVGQSDMPIYSDFAGKESQTDFGFTEEEERLLDACYVVAMRVYSGDNASCLNLYRPGRPQILGVPHRLFDGPQADERQPTSWPVMLQKLYRDQTKTPDPARVAQQPVPVALEKTVANYSFQLWGGTGETFDVATDSDKPLELQVEALLGPSPFLGNLLIAEPDFERLFPDEGGYRFFLIRTPEGKEQAVRAALERALGDFGFAAEPTVDRLASVSVVQNTYLLTFQSLGGLGLLLGLFGLLAVEVRNVMERRAELALLGAIGFPQRMVVTLLTLENGLLLVAGLVAGLVSAVVAILPHLTDTTASMPVGLLAWIVGLILLIGFLGLPPVAAWALRGIEVRDIQRDR